MNFYEQKSPERLREERTYKLWVTRIRAHMENENQKINFVNRDTNITQWMCEKLITLNNHLYLCYVPKEFLTENFYVKVYVRGSIELAYFPGNFTPTESFWKKVERIDPEKYYTTIAKRQFNARLVATLKLASDIAIFLYNQESKVKFNESRLSTGDLSFLEYYKELSATPSGMKAALFFFDLYNAKRDIELGVKGLSTEYRKILDQAETLILNARKVGTIDKMGLL